MRTYVGVWQHRPSDQSGIQYGNGPRACQQEVHHHRRGGGFPGPSCRGERDVIWPAARLWQRLVLRRRPRHLQLPGRAGSPPRPRPGRTSPTGSQKLGADGPASGAANSALCGNG